MQATTKLPASARLERELERERQQRHITHEERSGIHAQEGDRLKDARENFESSKVRR
jgi:hypothetical protein